MRLLAATSVIAAASLGAAVARAVGCQARAAGAALAWTAGSARAACSTLSCHTFAS